MGGNTLGFEYPAFLVDEEPTKLTVSVALELVGLTTSLTDGRRLIKQGGIQVNGVTQTTDRLLSTKDLMHGKWILFRKGKKTFAMMEVTDGTE
jgi:tyrosyl-tRNA synthetase